MEAQGDWSGQQSLLCSRRRERRSRTSPSASAGGTAKGESGSTSRLLSANAYIGAFSVAECLAKGAQIEHPNGLLVHKGKPVRVGYRIEADGTKVRVARPSGEVIK